MQSPPVDQNIYACDSVTKFVNIDKQRDADWYRHGPYLEVGKAVANNYKTDLGARVENLVEPQNTNLEEKISLDMLIQFQSDSNY